MQLVTSGVSDLYEGGAVTASGQKVDLDVLVMATGFDLDASIRPFTVLGRDDSTSLGELWGDCPRSYYGVTHPGFPNYFLLYGPGCNLVSYLLNCLGCVGFALSIINLSPLSSHLLLQGHNSILYVLECQANYIIDCVRRTVNSGRKTIELR